MGALLPAARRLVTEESQAGRTCRGAGRLSKPWRPISRGGLSPLHPEGPPVAGEPGSPLGPELGAERPCRGGAGSRKDPPGPDLSRAPSLRRHPHPRADPGGPASGPLRGRPLSLAKGPANPRGLEPRVRCCGPSTCLGFGEPRPAGGCYHPSRPRGKAAWTSPGTNGGREGASLSFTAFFKDLAAQA